MSRRHKAARTHAFLLATLLMVGALHLSVAQAQQANEEVGMPQDPDSAAQLSHLRALAEAEGELRVVIGLGVAIQPLGSLDAEARQAQNAAIEAAQEAVLSDLPASALVRRYRTTPALALMVTPELLDRLAARLDVVSITPDGVAAPSGGTAP